ncbi:hypothetical protein [Paraburkholderia ribeironis]|nr:hypothetical protein [Paraburkholderia ribeironis]
MWVRTVATAVAVWCASGAAMAAGYAEVWNPPESTGHVAKPAKKQPGAARSKSGASSKAASKANSKAASKHVVSARHAAPRIASSAPVAHGGGVKKVASKNIEQNCTQIPAASISKRHAAVMAQAGKPHAQPIRAKPDQGKVMRASLIQDHAARPQALKVVAKTGATKPPAAPLNASAASANVSAGPVTPAINPATASSGSLPPIIH